MTIALLTSPKIKDETELFDAINITFSLLSKNDMVAYSTALHHKMISELIIAHKLRHFALSPCVKKVTYDVLMPAYESLIDMADSVVIFSDFRDTTYRRKIIKLAGGLPIYNVHVDVRHLYQEDDFPPHFNALDDWKEHVDGCSLCKKLLLKAILQKKAYVSPGIEYLLFELFGANFPK